LWAAASCVEHSAAKPYGRPWSVHQIYFTLSSPAAVSLMACESYDVIATRGSCSGVAAAITHLALGRAHQFAVVQLSCLPRAWHDSSAAWQSRAFVLAYGLPCEERCRLCAAAWCSNCCPFSDLGGART
jgi:hypothetical protein